MSISFSQIRTHYGIGAISQSYAGGNHVPQYTRYVNINDNVTTAAIPTNGTISFSNFNNTFTSVGTASYNQSGHYVWTCPKDVTSALITYITPTGPVSQTVFDLNPGTGYTVDIGVAGANSLFGASRGGSYFGFSGFVSYKLVAPAFNTKVLHVDGQIDASRELWTTVATNTDNPITFSGSGGIGGGGSLFNAAYQHGLVCVANQSNWGDLGLNAVFTPVQVKYLNSSWQVYVNNWSSARNEYGGVVTNFVLDPPTIDDRGLNTYFVRTLQGDPYPANAGYSWDLYVKQVVGLRIDWHP